MNRSIKTALRNSQRKRVSTDSCPLCHADLTGSPIPEADRPSFGNHTHFSRKIGIYDYDLDRTIQWQCPNCNGLWDAKPEEL